MKKILSLFLLSFFSAFCVAQGISFGQYSNWNDVLAAAKRDGKGIFLDCYATWCGPCKWMEQEVFGKQVVGDLVNAHFIAVRIQADTSQNDPIQVRLWRPDAKQIINKYDVKGLPTFLFFSPEGDILHRFSGALPDSGFVTLVEHALDTNFQYYTRLERFKRGLLRYEQMPALALAAKINEDTSKARQIAQCYLKNYLDTLSGEGLFEKGDLTLIETFYQDVLSSKDKVFKTLFTRGPEIDEILRAKGFSDQVIDFIISKEEIEPEITLSKTLQGREPEWNYLNRKISDKYGPKYAEQTVVIAEINWYTQKEDWPKVTQYTMKRLEVFGIDRSTVFGRLVGNNILYNIIFKHSNKQSEILGAITLMRSILESETHNSPYYADFIDTYANLLYKGGRKQEGLVWEEKALTLKGNDAGIQQCLRKMKRNEPTWY